MRQFPLLMLLVWLGTDSGQGQVQAPVTAAKLDESEVRITYGELKRLVAATLPVTRVEPPKPKPPVPAALLSALYEMDVAAGVVRAEMQVENFDGGWQAVAVAGAEMGASAVEPAEARLVVVDDCLCLMTEKAGSAKATLTFPLAQDGQGTVLALAPAAVCSLTVKGLPEGKVVRLARDGATYGLTKNGAVALPCGGEQVLVTVEAAEKAQQTPVAGAVTDEAIINSASYRTQVVRDGSVLTEGSLVVRHDLPARLALALPEGAKLLQCRVNGEVVRLTMETNGGMKIPLDEPTTDGAESEVSVSFTQGVAELQPAEGEIELALPQAPLFARVIDWSVSLPGGYDLTFSGNVEAVTEPAKAASPGGSGLQLRKSLCRDQQPRARIVYRKR